ncbi:MAG TPA: DUF799 family lipoprotein [Smithellaceae bacterium]|nr:DUF799 family lipoprotein [Smithellaceae bacterium]HRS88324.1 DUF799 family lipoprotein [Smithellaceae bacterium]HRV24969.1 DUF799 family lipoprotein [Smithellaceae bacterium]
MKFKIPHVLIYFILIFLITAFAACSAKKQNQAKLDPSKNPVNIIAVMPVENKTKDEIAPSLLRAKIIDELYFKGYNKLSPEMIDRRLEELNTNSQKADISNIEPQRLRDLVGADAVLYSTLQKSDKPIGFFSAPVTVSLSCELRKSDNGEVIWRASHTAKSRNFAFTRKGREMKSCRAYEEVMEEVVNKIMETMPLGPNLRS